MSRPADQDTRHGGWLRRLFAAPRNSLAKTLLVPFVVSIVSALLVAGASISMRPIYESNQERNRQQNILAAADLLPTGPGVADSFENVVPRVVDLETGAYANDIDASSIEGLGGARASQRQVSIPKELDIAVIGRRSRYALVYLAYEGDRASMIILPVYGYGLWSTMYGYIALGSDANTIVGLRFYQQGETPGLGGEIDNPKWLRLWRGKQIYGTSTAPLIAVAKGRSAAVGDRAAFEVDGISGATLTGTGVTNLLRYWFGEHGFGPFLRGLRERGDLT